MDILVNILFLLDIILTLNLVPVCLHAFLGLVNRLKWIYRLIQGMLYEVRAW